MTNKKKKTGIEEHEMKNSSEGLKSRSDVSWQKEESMNLKTDPQKLSNWKNRKKKGRKGPQRPVGNQIRLERERGRKNTQRNNG